MDTEGFDALASEIEALVRGGDGARVFGDAGARAENGFGARALRVFAHQFRANPVYRAFCEGRGRTPDTVDAWQDVPPVPATAFKHLELVSADPEGVEAVFLTSGTTAGREGRGRHLVPRLSLYEASLMAGVRRHLLPGGESLPLLSLVPPPAEAPDSSLSHMVGTLARETAPSAAWLVDGSGRLHVDGFLDAAARVGGSEGGALVVGTAFAFVHLLDALEERGEAVALPPGTRVMETGGFKGRSRAVGREDLYAALEERLGVPGRRIVNEYGMTELLSQMYEPVLTEGAAARGRHQPPPWLRVRALDPGTLEPREPGEEGILAFYDLANVGSVAHVLTEDVGSVEPDGTLRLRGRAVDAEPRGCSLAMDELMASAGHGGAP